VPLSSGKTCDGASPPCGIVEATLLVRGFVPIVAISMPH